MSRPVLAAFGRAMRNPRVIVGGAIITVLAIVAIFAPWLAPHPPDDQNLLEALLPPAWSKGGSTSLSNLTMLCVPHNRAKGNR